MPDAVVDADEGEVPEQGECAGGDGDGLEWSAHAGAFGVADTIDIIYSDVGGGEGLADESSDVAAVVEGGVFGEEAFAWWGDVGLSDVGEDYCGRRRVGGCWFWVQDEADAEFVGGTFEAEGYHGWF